MALGSRHGRPIPNGLGPPLRFGMVDWLGVPGPEDCSALWHCWLAVQALWDIAALGGPLEAVCRVIRFRPTRRLWPLSLARPGASWDSSVYEQGSMLRPDGRRRHRPPLVASVHNTLLTGPMRG